ncbi:MAG: 3,4-dihydroxy-2-butanone-4-phosphate synthase, partial [Luteolibacter sp.]|uniref:3,4-dihydroxy-2-butanone-4-phosphate synthase n=1 Tax=Luteolibacter sp. TaxID=1962973 RepID=UPI00326635CF
MSKVHFDPISEVIADIRRGRMVIVTDDADRENEGDLVIAAAKVTQAHVNFMAKFGRGLICAPITEERAQKLGL